MRRQPRQPSRRVRQSAKILRGRLLGHHISAIPIRELPIRFLPFDFPDTLDLFPLISRD
jgi:hypothetical protein